MCERARTREVPSDNATYPYKGESEFTFFRG